MPTRNDSLELTEVKDRFEASRLALEEVRRRLSVLAELQERRVTASESLVNAAEQVDRFSNVAAQAVEALQVAHGKAIEAFDSMRSVVDGTDLRRVTDGLSAIDARISEAHDELRKAVELAEGHGSKLVELDAKLDILAAAVAAQEEAAAVRANEAAKRIEALAARIDDAARLSREKDELTSQLTRVERELAQVQENFARLSAVAGDRALKKAGLKEGGSAASLFG